MNTSVTTTSVQLTNSSRGSARTTSTLKLTTELRRDAYAQDLTIESSSAASPSTRSPISRRDCRRRSRASSRRARGARAQYVGALSLGDSYRPTDDLQMQYGVRVDGNRFDGEPVLNPTSSRLFGVAKRRRAESRVSRARASASRGCTASASQVGGFDGAFARSARGGARRHRHVPEHAERDVDRLGDGQHRAAERGAAAHLRRRRGADAGLGGVHGEHRRRCRRSAPTARRARCSRAPRRTSRCSTQELSPRRGRCARTSSGAGPRSATGSRRRSTGRTR